MPRQERHKTKYAGVFYILGTDPKGKKEKIYYVVYRNREGKLVEEKAGRGKKDRMNAFKANSIRTRRIQGEELSNKERREAEKEAKSAEAGRWTVARLWDSYREHRPDVKGSATDKSNFENYLKPAFGAKEPREILPLDVDRLRLSLSKKKAPGTVKNVLELLRRIINFGAKRNLCPPPPFKITLPRVNNLRTEDLSEGQLRRLLTVLHGEYMAKTDEKPFIPDPDARDVMLLALHTGMRRGEIFRLKWEDVDLRRGFLTIREPKGGTDQTIPLSEAARAILEARIREESPYVIPGRSGGQRKDIKKALAGIRKAAALPEGFRPLHGLRHVYASMLASSGAVDLFTLQKLLTHKGPAMTQRYAHLRDETLKKAANLQGDLVAEAGRAK
ncbi:MAG: integrase [Deltaproteobacteria bacterium RBG_19FT_COMBO_60_16]|nr:MAG: integrase [Deltaproteobacteria bacterium RBG_19FT_COMBO_60_16]